MKQLIIHGDPGIRNGAIIRYEGSEVVCFGINRNGEYHGPDRVQLWCTVGEEDESLDGCCRHCSSPVLASSAYRWSSLLAT